MRDPKNKETLSDQTQVLSIKASSESTPLASVENKQPKSSTTSTTNEDVPSEEVKELSALERIKAEREHEKAHPQKPLVEAEGVWKSKLWVVPTALLYGAGG